MGLHVATLGNGATETRNYNNRTWLGSMSVVKSGTTLYSLGLTYAGNGNVLTANDNNVNGNWTYTYDNLNRLHTAAVTGQSFTYNPDRYGNMTCTNSVYGGKPLHAVGPEFHQTGWHHEQPDHDFRLQL